jgi:CheY-like chemotaxis protein
MVMALAAAGLNNCEIARRTGIPRGTVSDWRLGRRPHLDRTHGTCTVCRGEPSALPQAPYTYLLGLFLGDGCLAAHPRGVYKLRVSCASRYPELIRLCELAMTRVLPNRVGRVEEEGCTEVYSYSKHWVCLFPQHGPGRKHERRIELAGWQQDLVDLDPRPLLRGLLHSDGCRVLNWVNGPRTRATTSPTSRPTSGPSSGGPATRWGSSGGPTTARACRWPGGGAWHCWTASSGPSAELTGRRFVCRMGGLLASSVPSWTGGRHVGERDAGGAAAARGRPVSRPTVMVADDHQRFREALVAVLELDGFEVVGQAADGADAVALAKQLQPDVIMMDLSMPVLNGLDATRLVRDALPSTPVVVFTAFTGAELERAALAAGATAYLAKDANLEELRATLAAAVAALADRSDLG